MEMAVRATITSHLNLIGNTTTLTKRELVFPGRTLLRSL